MDNQEKLAAQGTQDEEKQIKNLTQYVLDTTTRKQTQTTQARHAPYYKPLGVNKNRTSCLCGNRNEHHNTEFIQGKNENFPLS